MEETKIFQIGDRTTRTSTIGLDVLELSSSFNPPPQNRPARASETLHQIHSIFKKLKLPFHQELIHIPNSPRYSRRVLTLDEEQQYDSTNTPITKWVFDRMISKITIPDEGGNRPGIGILYHDQGIQISFGLNVDVCDNFCVLGGVLLSTYGTSSQEKHKLADIFLRLEDWLRNYELKVSLARKVLDTFLAFEVERNQVYELIGRLQFKAAKQAINQGRAPLDTSQMNKFPIHFIEAAKKIEDRQPTLWDMYMIGTNLLKPEHQDMTRLNENNALFGKFLAENVAKVEFPA